MAVCHRSPLIVTRRPAPCPTYLCALDEHGVLFILDPAFSFDYLTAGLLPFGSGFPLTYLST
jgi:hypothetical protein